MLASFLVSMIPMHRGIVVGWVAIGLVELWQNRRNAMWWRRAAWKRVALLASFYGVLAVTKAVFPYIYEDRVADPSNVYGRIAEYRQSLAVLLDHLWLGAGLEQFNHVVAGENKYRFYYRGVAAIDSPHNTIVNVATDTGLLGLSFFTLSQFFLLAGCRKLMLKKTPNHFACWTFISIFVGYWVFGMDVGSGFLSELNMWYMFAVAICFKYAYTEPYTGLLFRANQRDTHTHPEYSMAN